MVPPNVSKDEMAALQQQQHDSLPPLITTPRQSAAVTPTRRISPSPIRSVETKVVTINTSSAVMSPNILKERDDLKVQLQQAVAAHTSLMKEFVALTNEFDERGKSIAQLRNDMRFLDELYQKSTHAVELHAAEIRTLQAEKDHLGQAVLQLQQDNQKILEEKASVIQQKDSLTISQRELDALRQTLEKTILERDSLRSSLDTSNEKLKQCTEELRCSNAASQELKTQLDNLTTREKNQREEHRVAMEAQEQGHAERMKDQLAALTSHFESTRQASLQISAAEREELKQTALEANRKVDQLEDALRGESAAHAAETARLKEGISDLTAQRDALLADAKSQLQLIAELRGERADARADLASLRQTKGTEVVVLHSANGADARCRELEEELLAAKEEIARLREEGQAMHQDLQEAIATAEESLTKHNAIAVSEAVSSAIEKATGQPEAASESAVAGESGGETTAPQGTEVEDSEEAIATLQFEVAELRRQLQHHKEKLSNLQTVQNTVDDQAEEISSLEETLQDFRERLEHEEQCHEDTKKNLYKLLDTKEEALRTINDEMRSRIDVVNRQLQEQQQENKKLVEECDSLRVALHDMEQVLADALSTTSP